MTYHIRPAVPADVPLVSSILLEVAAWLLERGDVMWEVGELSAEQIAEEVAAGQFFVAEGAGEAVGVVRFQEEDLLFWPDVDQHESAFVHRLAVRRTHAGLGVSQALLQWAVEHASVLGKRFLRLDCDEQRTQVREVYARFGFRFHSYRQVGPYYVARYEYRLDDSSLPGR